MLRPPLARGPGSLGILGLALILPLACSDAPSARDAGAPQDAEVFSDAASLDAGSPDAGSTDAGSHDATPADAGPADAAPLDATPLDATPLDAGPLDAAPFDAAPFDASSPDASGRDGGTAGPPGSVLPVTYTRADVGAPLSQAELDQATDELIALLRGTRYFEVLDERVHGWPETDPGHGFWYGTWWSGVTVTKASGVVTYRHSPDGADNNGLRTAPLLEGACYAHLMWGGGLSGHLVQKIARGYSSWALAMKRDANDTAGTMLARAHYPASVTSNDGGRALFIDYSADRPGVDGTSEYVHLPSNPTFGDIWIKNKRSKDDMGQVLRSLVQAQACAPFLTAEAQADLTQATELLRGWARQVEADSWGIATLDAVAQVWMPPISETLAHYITLGNLECPGVLAIRLLADGDPGSWSCGDGISALERNLGGQINNSARQIVRTHHEAAVNLAFFTGQGATGSSLLDGLAWRVESDLAAVTQANPPGGTNPSDIAALLLHAANAGLPLTSMEVRWLHGRIHLAYTSYLAAPATTYDVFAASSPDGTYPFEPAGDGLAFGELGALIGACAAPYRNPSARPIFDCPRLLAAF